MTLMILIPMTIAMTMITMLCYLIPMPMTMATEMGRKIVTMKKKPTNIKKTTMVRCFYNQHELAK